MPLQVLHVTPYFEAAWAYGGIPRVVGAMSRALAARGIDITVATTDACTADSRWLRHDRSTIRAHQNLEVQVFSNLSNGLAYHLQLFAPRGLSTYLRRRASHFDLFHIHACHNILSAMAAKAADRAGIPYLLSPHGTAPRIERRYLAKWLFDALFAGSLLPRATRVVAVSNMERLQLRGMGIPPQRIEIVPNPLDFGEFHDLPEKGGFRRRFGLGDPPIVAFLGRLTPRKHIDLLIRAFARSRTRECHLVIAGNDMGVASSLRRLAGDLGISSRVTFTGLLPADERLMMLRDIDLLVYPSEHEAFGLVPFEALLCGTPVVVGPDAGCAEGLEESLALRRLHDWKSSSLADEIDSLLDAEELGVARETLDEACRSAAAVIRLRSDPAAIARQLEEIYLSIAAPRERGPTS